MCVAIRRSANGVQSQCWGEKHTNVPINMVVKLSATLSTCPSPLPCHPPVACHFDCWEIWLFTQPENLYLIHTFSNKKKRNSALLFTEVKPWTTFFFLYTYFWNVWPIVCICVKDSSNRQITHWFPSIQFKLMSMLIVELHIQKSTFTAIMISIH